VHVDGDVVNGMAACQPVVLVCVLCGGRMEAAFLREPKHVGVFTVT
jgi:hypothetical protein